MMKVMELMEAAFSAGKTVDYYSNPQLHPLSKENAKTYNAAWELYYKVRVAAKELDEAATAAAPKQEMPGD